MLLLGAGAGEGGTVVVVACPAALTDTCVPAVLHTVTQAPIVSPLTFHNLKEVK